jgi:hypothetical protein
MSTARERTIRRRLAVQRLTSPGLPEVVDVVRLLLCSQAQDAPLARFSLGLRTAGATDETVRAAIDDGSVVRTHILRPTWHFVAAEDLRWLLELTSAKVESGMAARHRRLALTSAVVDRAMDELATILAGRRFLTRSAITAAFRDAGIATANDQVGHLILLAELRGLVASGPLRGREHAYALVDEVVAPTPRRERDEAVRELVRRFFAGHGPASVTDLTRWAKVTQTEVKAALADLAGQLESLDVDGTTLWFDPALDPGGRAGRHAFLLPTFDEAFLSYPRVNFPRAVGHPRGADAHSFAEAGGGLVVCDGHDAGWWKRQELAGHDEITVRLALATDLDARQRAAVLGAAERLGAFAGRRLVVEPIDAVDRPVR